MSFTKKYNDLVFNKYGGSILLSGIEDIVDYILENYDDIPDNFIKNPLKDGQLDKIPKGSMSLRNIKQLQLGRGHCGGEIIDPKVDLIKSLDSFWKEITGEGLTKKQVKNIQKKKQHGGNWWDMAKLLNTLNNFMIQPPPTVDTETGEVVVRSGFDMI